MARRRRISTAFAGVVLTMLACALILGTALAQTNLPLLTTARQVHQLSSDQAASRYPVRVRGVITFCDESLGQLFVQDETAGIFVEIHGDYGFRLHPGQLLEIAGVSTPGGFAPDIEPHQVRFLTEAPLPPPRSVTYEQMAAGQQDCNWVEFSGIVRSVGPHPFTPVGLKLAGGGTVMVPIKDPDRESCLKLVDAEVSVRGVCIAHFNRKGQLIQVAVQISSMNDISVRQPAPEDPFDAPTRKISNLLQYAPLQAPGHRVKVQGVVTLQRLGQSLFIADETQGVYVQTAQNTSVSPGDTVEVLGFPGAGAYVAPVLQDATFRKIGNGPPAAPVRISVADAGRDTNHAALVQLEALLLNRVERRRDLLLELQSDNRVFDAELDTPAGSRPGLGAIPNGSKVLITGVCLVPEDQDWLSPRPQSLSLLLRSSADVTLLERPSWWTVRHTLWVLAATVAVFCASLAWVSVLHRQVRAQTQIIAEKIQREAALDERARIARDLHDDLGASLTHISFLSEVARKEHSPATMGEHLQEISGSSREAFQALDEIVWVVNPKNDTVEGLNNYICQFATHFFQGTPTRCRFDLPTSLPECPIPTEVRNNLFFAVKEALNNVRKHAAATEVVLRIRLEPGTFTIQIEDNGRGFVPEKTDSSRNGLMNMKDRLEKIRGRFTLETRHGSGTRIQLLVPVPRL